MEHNGALWRGLDLDRTIIKWDPGMVADRRPERLDSWKEIAAYLRKGITTVQRWERDEGLPVHRHEHQTLSSVYAYPAELDAWQESRKKPAAQRSANATVPTMAEPIPEPVAAKPRLGRRMWIAGASVTLAGS